MNSPRPGVLSVIKRDGRVVDFEQDFIRIAVMKAFMSDLALGGGAAASVAVNAKALEIASDVAAVLARRMPSGGVVHIEDIQDQVELALMRRGEQKVARNFVIYREQRRVARLERRSLSRNNVEGEPTISCTMADGRVANIYISQIVSELSGLMDGIPHVNPDEIVRRMRASSYDGITYKDLWVLCLMECRTCIETEPNYSLVAARVLWAQLYKEVANTLGLEVFDYRAAFTASIQFGIANEFLNPALAMYDMEALNQAIRPERDHQFRFLGAQTLYDRYLLHKDDNRFEAPQIFFMRVAMGLAMEEEDFTAKTIEFYNLMSSFDYMASTPTLFNAGTMHPQLSSCYLTSVPDDLYGIYGAIQDNAMLSKWAGGLGNDWTPVRSLGSHIKGTNGRSQGVVPFLKVANDTAVAVNQGGKRKGAVCAYLETWHLDIEEFLELRKNTGDDRRRTHDMNTANWVPDLFMKRVFEDGEWTLMSPSSAPDLHDLTGTAFEARYCEYEAMVREGKLRPSKVVRATELWRKMIGMLFETGHPWITFKDACNLRSPQQHCGVVHSSNLCTEITLNTKAGEEIAVCNLGSINLMSHVSASGQIDMAKLKNTVRTAIRMLDNVIDINFYAAEAAKTANIRHRPVGLGLMGFQDTLYKMNVPYASQEAVEFADLSMEAISYFAIEASADLAGERGAYPTFDGSLWSQGVLPMDSLKILAESRGKHEYLMADRSSTLDWSSLRERVIKGMRNSNVMAIAPTATISNIIGVSQSIEPTYQNLYVKSNLSGEFTVINEALVERLREMGVWDAVMVNDLKHHEGSLANIHRIDDRTKAVYLTAFEVEPRWIVEAASRRQKWIDQAQSLNLYISGANGRKLDIVYRMAWATGLKTTYYLRALAATSTEKSTIHTGALNAVDSGVRVEPAPVPKACSIGDEGCTACE